MGRERYATVDELCEDISSAVNAGIYVTLAFDNKWWTKRSCFPNEKMIMYDAILFSKDFKEEDIIATLKSKGLEYIPYKEQGYIGSVSKV